MIHAVLRCAVVLGGFAFGVCWFPATANGEGRSASPPAADSPGNQSTTNDSPGTQDKVGGSEQHDSDVVPSIDTSLHEDASAPPTSQAEPAFSADILDLRDRIRKCLSYYGQQHENVAHQSPWSIMHTLIAATTHQGIACGGNSCYTAKQHIDGSVFSVERGRG